MTLSKPIVTALVIGLLVGAIAARWAEPYAYKRWGRDQFHRQLLERFSNRLQLTPEQREKVAAILNVKRQKIEALRDQTRPKFDEIRMAASAEIRQFLDPAQQQRFDRLEAEWKARWERHRARRK